MKTLNRFINFSLFVLAVTNLWIILFTSILTQLSFLHPPVVKEALLRNIAFPNPAKIPLYLVLTVIFVFLYWCFNIKSSKIPVLNDLGSRLDRGTHWSEKHGVENFMILVKLIIFLLLLFLFLTKLGLYPMTGEFFPYSLRPDTSIYFLVISLYLLFIALVIIQSAVLFRLLGQKKLFLPLFLGFLILLVAFLTFEARFPISGLDYAFFIGPIQEIAKGKTIYTDVPIQHGFLSILTFTLLYKLHVLQLAYLPVFIWILYIIQYVLSFYFILKTSKSISIALIGMFSIITLNYFSLSELPGSYPQIGPMRWLPSVITLLLFLKVKKIDSKKLIFLIALMSLWLVDAGIALVLGYGFTVFILFLSKNISFRRLIASGLKLLVSYILILLAINIFHLLAGYKMVDLMNIFHTLNKYASLGIAQLPVESHNYFWIVILIYFSSIIYFFRNQKNIQVGGESGRAPDSAQRSEHWREGNSRQNLPELILISANLMFFAAIYFVGRAHPHNLFNIALLPILTLFLLIGACLKDIDNRYVRLALMALLFITLIVYPAFQRKITMTEMIITKVKRLTQDNIFKPEMDEILSKRYAQETKLITNNLKEDAISIVSNDDTYLFYLTGKKNLLDANPQVGIDTYSDLDRALSHFVKMCPKKIVVDCAIVGRCSQSAGFDQSGFFPQPIILDQMQKQCKMKYEPITCTNQLCIAQAK